MKKVSRFLALLLAIALLPLSFVAVAQAEEPVTITIWGSDRENMPFRNGLETIELLKEKAPWCKVVVGGAVLNQEYADRIGADRYARDAMETIRYADKVDNAR